MLGTGKARHSLNITFNIYLGNSCLTKKHKVTYLKFSLAFSHNHGDASFVIMWPKYEIILPDLGHMITESSPWQLKLMKSTWCGWKPWKSSLCKEFVYSFNHFQLNHLIIMWFYVIDTHISILHTMKSWFHVKPNSWAQSTALNIKLTANVYMFFIHLTCHDV